MNKQTRQTVKHVSAIVAKNKHHLRFEKKHEACIGRHSQNTSIIINQIIQ